MIALQTKAVALNGNVSFNDPKEFKSLKNSNYFVTFTENKNDEVPILTTDHIQKTVANYLNLPIEVMETKIKNGNYVRARQLSIFLMHELLPHLVWRVIGAKHGGRDHSTCMWANDYIESQLFIKNDEITRQVSELRLILKPIEL